MAPVIGLSALELLGATIIVLVACGLRMAAPLACRPFEQLLFLSFQLVQLVTVLVSALWALTCRPSPYGDVCVPYLIVPGIHIYMLFDGLSSRLFNLLNGTLDAKAAALVSLVIMPGVGAVLLGGAQWWVIGRILRPCFRANSPRKWGP